MNDLDLFVFEPIIGGHWSGRAKGTADVVNDISGKDEDLSIFRKMLHITHKRCKSMCSIFSFEPYTVRFVWNYFQMDPLSFTARHCHSVVTKKHNLPSRTLKMNNID